MTDKQIIPCSPEIERAVIGACIISPDALSRVIEILKPEDFYDISARTVYRVILRMYESGSQVDILTVSDELMKAGEFDRIGGEAYITEVLSRITTTVNAGYHADILKGYSVRRKLISACEKISGLAYKGDKETPEILSETERLIFDASQGKEAIMPLSAGEISEGVFREIEEAYKSGGRKLQGYASGFEDLDRIITGFQPGSLNIIAARPSMGKTALALNIAQFGGNREKNPCVLIFSLEMSREQLMQRMYSSESNVKLNAITRGIMSEEEFYCVSRASESISRKDIHISDRSELSITEFRSQCRRFKLRHPELALIVVDYIQLMNTGKKYHDNRTQEVSEISRTLKSAAIELGCPVIALSQLSRETEKRTEKKPRLSDLRDSGAIEQDADVVMFLYREDYYQDSTKIAEKYDSKAELNVAKNRTGRTGTCNLTFRREYTRFTGYTEDY